MTHKPQSMPVGHGDVSIPNCRCVMTPLIRKALRTYPKRMSRAKRKEARSRERRRVEQDNQWWSKR